MKTREQLKAERQKKGFCTCKECLDSDISLERAREQFFGSGKGVKNNEKIN